MDIGEQEKSLAIVSAGGGGNFGGDDLESDGLDKVATTEGSKTVGKGNCCLGWGKIMYTYKKYNA